MTELITMLNEARKTAGYRELYALTYGHGQIIFVNSEKCIRFTYSKDDPYQDANGAIYNTVCKTWID